MELFTTWGHAATTSKEVPYIAAQPQGSGDRGREECGMRRGRKTGAHWRQLWELPGRVSHSHVMAWPWDAAVWRCCRGGKGQVSCGTWMLPWKCLVVKKAGILIVQKLHCYASEKLSPESVHFLLFDLMQSCWFFCV